MFLIRFLPQVEILLQPLETTDVKQSDAQRMKSLTRRHVGFAQPTDQNKEGGEQKVVAFLKRNDGSLEELEEKYAQLIFKNVNIKSAVENNNLNPQTQSPYMPSFLFEQRKQDYLIYQQLQSDAETWWSNAASSEEGSNGSHYEATEGGVQFNSHKAFHDFCYHYPQHGKQNETDQGRTFQRFGQLIARFRQKQEHKKKKESNHASNTGKRKRKEEDKNQTTPKQDGETKSKNSTKRKKRTQK
ncbi:hypothetical protein QOT17_017774 [Balamuthia mandrillaris]